MANTQDTSEEQRGTPVHYCDRCARRSSDLVFDDLSLRELCAECRRELERRRIGLHRPAKASRTKS